ncbi:MAG: preprotein translocase subunit SecA [Alphaproteobacteria bacterium]|nr:preprotein translocase subunit SecA [Alphaproteobacteria bacterium]MDD9919538.1 preprotein translocase subunit SecA [Alphaproteobacteria bacterium]
MSIPLLGKIFGNKNDRILKKLRPLVSKIGALENEIHKNSDEELKQAFQALKERYQQGETLNDLLVESFAITREAALRALGLRPFDVQLMGGIILHQGKIAEMKTGEGKTLMATLAASLNALSGNGVHMVTVNDYLAQRDAEWMRPVFEQLGLTCAFVTNSLDSEERRAAYAADITYATNNELGFDYLRDNMSYAKEQLVQRGQPFAIVDEVDSILIDEARTPLIISGPMEDKRELYFAINEIIPNFKEEEDFERDEKMRAITLTDEGTDKAEQLLIQKGLMQEGESLYDISHVSLVHHVNNGLRAHHLFQKDVHYIIKDEQVVLIDEFTGRMTPGRRLSDGLHQAIEAREEVPLQQENQQLASVTFQNYFRLYTKLAGMTGTAETEIEEFQEIYNLDVVVVPTNVPIAREDAADILFLHREGKINAVIEDIKDCYQRGQPVLVGTTSIEKSEELAKYLEKEKVPHQVLNARYHEQEAQIIAQAGRKGAVTIATNMAGRGTDIKLGGNLELLQSQAKDEHEEAEIKAAYEKEKNAVLEAGGLRVIGTERHESRRIDNQLRGRSGRQGDAGSSVFYLSVEDDLLRIFAGSGFAGRIVKTMQDKNDDPNESIQSRIFSKSVETAQRKIEGMHFDARKHILKFDNILNEQRKVIYEQRRDILTSKQVDDIVRDFRADMLDLVLETHMSEGTSEETWDIENLNEELYMLFDIQEPVAKWVEQGTDMETIHKHLTQSIETAWANKEKELGKEMLRNLESYLLLQTIDRQWRGHLQQLDHLRQGINLRGYAQKDPLNEFSREAFVLFDQMLMSIRRETVTLLSRLQVAPEDTQALEEAQEEAQALVNQSGTLEEENPWADKKIPRNAPCPCGSGKKFKHCHGALTAAA